MSAIQRLFDHLSKDEDADYGDASLEDAEREYARIQKELADLRAQLDAKKRAIKSAISALREVIHDRPTAHTDAIWEQVNTTLDGLEKIDDALPFTDASQSAFAPLTDAEKEFKL